MQLTFPPRLQSTSGGGASFAVYSGRPAGSPAAGGGAGDVVMGVDICSRSKRSPGRVGRRGGRSAPEGTRREHVGDGRTVWGELLVSPHARQRTDLLTLSDAF